MITLDDIESSHPEWVEPISTDIYGLTAWTVPPNSQGYIALLAGAVFESVAGSFEDEADWWHLAIESTRQAAADRDRILADPDSADVDSGGLLAPSRIAQLADRIDPARVMATEPRSRLPGGTAYMCVTDSDGVAVSLIQSNYHGIGSSRAVPDGGFILHDRGRGFSLEAGHPNELRAGRRPMHTLSPTLWTRSGRIDTILGTRGGDAQPQLVMQLAASLMGRDLPPGRAMAVPRWKLGSPHGAESRVELEPGTPQAVISGLQERGHLVQVHSEPQPGWGPMSVIRVSEGGLRTGAADPRVDTAAVGVG
jgi:gamma-glutamyltranspeptidase/glutathione hydrolase